MYSVKRHPVDYVYVGSIPEAVGPRVGQSQPIDIAPRVTEVEEDVGDTPSGFLRNNPSEHDESHLLIKITQQPYRNNKGLS